MVWFFQCNGGGHAITIKISWHRKTLTQPFPQSFLNLLGKWTWKQTKTLQILRCCKTHKIKHQNAEKMQTDTFCNILDEGKHEGNICISGHSSLCTLNLHNQSWIPVGMCKCLLCSQHKVKMEIGYQNIVHNTHGASYV